MNVKLAAAVLTLFLAAPGTAAGYTNAELKKMFQRSVDTEDLRERARLRTLIAKAAPDSAYGLASRAFLLSDSITPQATISIYTKALELDPTIAVAYYNRANAYGDLRQHALAEEGYKKAISLGFDKGMAYAGLANAQYALERNAEAEKNFTKALKLDPKQHFAYNNRGAIYLMRKEYDKAIADFNAALKLAQFAMAYMNRGDAWAGKKEFQKALADYSTAEGMIGAEPDLRTRRGKMYLKVPDYPKAREEFGLALADAPGHAVALHGLGNACYYQKDYDCAEDAYKRAIAAAPDKADAYVALATTYQYKKRLDLAAETLKTAVARLPGRKDLREKLIAVQTWTGDAKGSEASLTEVISSGGAKAQDYFSRGQARLENKDYKGAEADLKQALKGNPDSAYATVYLALAFLGSGRRSEALELFSSVADTDSSLLAKLREGAAVGDKKPGGNVRAKLREMLTIYDEASEGEPPAAPAVTAGRSSSARASAALSQDDCYCVHYTGGMPPYFLAKAPGAPAGCKSVKFKPDPAKPGVSGLRSCKEFQETE
ncbi:MAG: tetratricopeptide repeat protein [Elusimicrobiales bacterium]